MFHIRIRACMGAYDIKCIDCMHNIDYIACLVCLLWHMSPFFGFSIQRGYKISLFYHVLEVRSFFSSY